MFQIMKIVKAIPPYIYKGASNFKYYPCEAWEKIGGKVSLLLLKLLMCLGIYFPK